MVTPVLQRVRIDPDAVDDLREHFDHLDDNAETYRRGLALEDTHFEAAWIEERGDDAVLYYFEEHGDDGPPEDAEDRLDSDDELTSLAERHHEAFEAATPDDAEWTQLDPVWFESTDAHGSDG